MASPQSMWHVNDVVAYDAMRDLSGSVQARLLERVRQRDQSAMTELLKVRLETIAVDGYDRAAVTSYRQQLQDLEHTLVASSAG